MNFLKRGNNTGRLMTRRSISRQIPARDVIARENWSKMPLMDGAVKSRKCFVDSR